MQQSLSLLLTSALGPLRTIFHLHSSSSLLYLFDGASSDAFDETFRTWSDSSVGYGASPIVFGPQFASAQTRALSYSIDLISSAVRRADRRERACSQHISQHGPEGSVRQEKGREAKLAGLGVTSMHHRWQPTSLIFRSPAFNIDP